MTLVTIETTLYRRALRDILRTVQDGRRTDVKAVKATVEDIASRALRLGRDASRTQREESDDRQRPTIS